MFCIRFRTFFNFRVESPPSVVVLTLPHPLHVLTVLLCAGARERFKTGLIFQNALKESPTANSPPRPGLIIAAPQSRDGLKH